MTTPLTTSVTVDFCPRNSSTPSSALTGTLIDNRNYLTLNLSYTDSVANFVNAQVLIDSIDATSPATLKSYNLKLGQNFIGTSSSVSANDIRHSFTDLSRYSIKIKAVTNDGSVTTLYSQYANDESPSSSYNFLFRSDGGDVFDVDANCNVTNPNDIEGAADNVIEIVCPLIIAEPVADSRVPSKLLFTFDESDDYVGTANDTDNSEQLSGCSFLVDYVESGNYSLTQTSDNHLTNDASYAVSVTAIYDSANGGHTVSKTLDDLVHAIASPVIDHVVAYGLGEDQTDADDATISSVMNVYLTPESSPVKILPASGKVTFKLSQDVNVFYSAEMDVSSTTDSYGNYVYTILKSDLTKLWTTTPPVQNANKSYTFDVTAEVEYTILSGSVVKTSNIVPATFTSDINQLSSVNLVNAWMAATNVAASGNRTVNISNATTASGYSVAPELGLIVTIPKNDFYGSAITAGFFVDLDAVDSDGNPTTHHKFMMSTDGGVTYEPVTKLYQIQGDSTKTIQENCIDLLSLTAGDAIENDDGLYPNIPGTPSVLGSAQPPIYAWIPNGFSQQDSVKISVAIVPPSGLTTLPAPTESDEVVAVNKINRYEMTVGPDSVSEPRFTGTGADGELVVPIHNPTTATTDDFYFSSAIFSSNLSSPNDSVTQTVSNDGVFDITIEDPSIRGTATTCDYTVAYKIDDPNGGTITGPDSILYSIYLKDEPTKDNFTVSNFSYNTFNDDGESSFKFDIVFNNVGDTSIDGANVYFSSNNDDANNSNDIPETLVLTVERLDGDSQSNLTVTLQSTAPTTSALTDGVKIGDSDGVLSSNTWKNFRSGTITFKPYYTARVTSSNDAQIEIDDEKTEDILNIPVVGLPANVSLTGGVIESYDDTRLDWDNDLVIYSGLSSITASYDLALNGADQTNNITANDSYTVDLGSTPSTYTLELCTKVSSNVDANVYYSKKVVVEFDSVSVDESGMNVTVNRGSNDVNLNAQFAAHTTLPNPASNLNVTEVKLVNNSTSDANTNPEDAGVKVLTCSNNTTSVQVDATVNSYDLTADEYEQANLINLIMRIEAGVNYTLQYGDSSASNEESTPMYLALNSPSKPYVVATKPSVEILTRYPVTSGPYAGQTALSMIINGNGAKNEGAQSVIVIMATEGDYTDANNGSGSGAEIILAFESSNARLRSYTVGASADVTLNSADNLGASEVHILLTENTEGFSESTSTGDFTLVMGTLDNSDASTLYMPADCEFTTSPISVVVVVSTRLGTDVDMKQLN